MNITFIFNIEFIKNVFSPPMYRLQMDHDNICIMVCKGPGYLFQDPFLISGINTNCLLIIF